MLPGDCGFSPEEIKEIYEELDLHEEGITEEEIIRRKTRIFVGGLKFASEDHVLHDYFATFGKIKEAVVIRDRKTGLSKGYGFVTMLEDLPALKAIVEKSPKLDGRRCNVNLAYIGQKKKPLAKKSYPKIRDIQHLPPHMYGYPNGIMVPPTLMMGADGQYYQIGMQPMPGHPSMYQIPMEAPPPYDGRDMYPEQAQMAMMYQNPVQVLPHQIVLENPINPATNNNNNNIYLTNNIYYHTSDSFDGRTEYKDNTKLSFCGAISTKAMPQYILPQPPIQGGIPVPAIEPPNYNFDNELQPTILNKNSPAIVEVGNTVPYSDANKANGNHINSYVVVNSNSRDDKVHTIGVASYVTDNTAHVVVATGNHVNGGNHVTSISSSTANPSSREQSKNKNHAKTS